MLSFGGFTKCIQTSEAKTAGLQQKIYEQHKVSNSVPYAQQIPNGSAISSRKKVAKLRPLASIRRTSWSA